MLRHVTIIGFVLVAAACAFVASAFFSLSHSRMDKPPAVISQVLAIRLFHLTPNEIMAAAGGRVPFKYESRHAERFVRVRKSRRVIKLPYNDYGYVQVHTRFWMRHPGHKKPSAFAFTASQTGKTNVDELHATIDKIKQPPFKLSPPEVLPQSIISCTPTRGRNLMPIWTVLTGAWTTGTCLMQPYSGTDEELMVTAIWLRELMQSKDVKVRVCEELRNAIAFTRRAKYGVCILVNKTNYDRDRKQSETVWFKTDGVEAYYFDAAWNQNATDAKIRVSKER